MIGATWFLILLLYEGGKAAWNAGAWSPLLLCLAAFFLLRFLITPPS